MTTNRDTSGRNRTWTRYFGDPNIRVTPDGDLVLSVQDLVTRTTRPIMEWAAAKSFSVEGIPPMMASAAVLAMTIGKALAELPDDAPQLGAMEAVLHGAKPDIIPDFRVLVDGDYIAKLLVNTFDGPFRREKALRNAVAARLGTHRRPGRPPHPLNNRKMLAALQLAVDRSGA